MVTSIREKVNNKKNIMKNGFVKVDAAIYTER